MGIGLATVLALFSATEQRASGARRGDWLQTFTGRQFWPLDPRIEDISLVDIAHSLSMQCRYAGHCHRFYSARQEFACKTTTKENESA